MALTFNIYFTGEGTQPRDYANEVIEAGLVKQIQEEAGNIRYDFFFHPTDPGTLLLVERWEDQRSIDRHLQLPGIKAIQAIRSKYNLSFKIERFVDAE